MGKETPLRVTSRPLEWGREPDARWAEHWGHRMKMLAGGACGIV